jgi:hypothetical protein
LYARAWRGCGRAEQVTRRVPQGGADVATKGTDGEVAAAGGDVAAGGDQQAQLQEDWTAFVKWFRSNGGIISSKLTVKVTSQLCCLTCCSSHLVPTCLRQGYARGMSCMRVSVRLQMRGGGRWDVAVLDGV